MCPGTWCLQASVEDEDGDEEGEEDDEDGDEEGEEEDEEDDDDPEKSKQWSSSFLPSSHPPDIFFCYFYRNYNNSFIVYNLKLWNKFRGGEWW